jgi:hypothetical protein
MQAQHKTASEITRTFVAYTDIISNIRCSDRGALPMRYPYLLSSYSTR